MRLHQRLLQLARDAIQPGGGTVFAGGRGEGKGGIGYSNYSKVFIPIGLNSLASRLVVLNCSVKLHSNEEIIFDS